MNCPECESENTRVYRTIRNPRKDYRYVFCLDCKHEFGTLTLWLHEKPIIKNWIKIKMEKAAKKAKKR